MQRLIPINVGQQANDRSGDPLRDGMAKVNENFAKVQTGVEAVEAAAGRAQQRADAAHDVGLAAGRAATQAQASADAAAQAATDANASALAGGAAAANAQSTADRARIEASAAQTGADGAQRAANEANAGVKDVSLAVAGLDARVRGDYVEKASVGKPSGVAPLGADGLVPNAFLPSFDSVPVGFLAWCPSRSKIWDGWLPADGDAHLQQTFPAMAKMIKDGNVPLIDNAEWWNKPHMRGKWSLFTQDGKDYFRIPDLNGKQPGGLGRVFLSGDGAHSAEEAGAIQMDAMQPIIGMQPMAYGTTTGRGSGPFYGSAMDDGGTRSSPTYPVTAAGANIRFDSSLVTRTSDETRPRNVTGCWVVKAYGVTINADGVDLGGLVNQVTATQARIEQVNTALLRQVNPALAEPGKLNLAQNGLITGKLTGALAPDSLRFKSDGTGADKSTFVSAVPSAAGTVAGFIARSRDQADSQYLSMQFNSANNWGALVFDRLGSSGAPMGLQFVGPYGICGQIESGIRWTFGPFPVKTAANTRTIVSYVGAGNQWGTLYAPQNNGGAACVFQNQDGVIVGDISLSATSTAYNSASDYRLKSDRRDMPPDGALASILALRPVTFTWKSTGQADEGFIAHELQAEVPGAVTGSKDDPDTFQRVNMPYLMPRVVAALQGAVRRIEQLEAKVAELLVRAG